MPDGTIGIDVPTIPDQHIAADIRTVAGKEAAVTHIVLVDRADNRGIRINDQGAFLREAGAAGSATSVSVGTASTSILAVDGARLRRCVWLTNFGTSRVFIALNGAAAVNAGTYLDPGDRMTFTSAPNAEFRAISASGTNIVGILVEAVSA